MPIFGQPVLGALRRDRQPEQLARQADGIFANVDDFLHLAARFGQDLAVLDRQELRQRLLMLAHQQAVAPDEFAAMRRRHVLPDRESRTRVRDHRVHVARLVGTQGRELRPVDRRKNLEVRILAGIERQPERAEYIGDRTGKAALYAVADTGRNHLIKSVHLIVR